MCLWYCYFINMQKTQLALFPLQLFLLPGEKTKLHIFEDRYKQLLEDCSVQGIKFGIPYALNGYLGQFGCVVEVSDISKQHQNGSADIEVTGIAIFELKHFYTRLGDKLYPGGDVNVIRNDQIPSLSRSFMREMDNYVRSIAPEKFEDVLAPRLNAYDAARILELNEEDKLRLVQASSQERKERILLNQLRILQALHEQKSSVVNNIFLN